MMTMLDSIREVDTGLFIASIRKQGPSNIECKMAAFHSSAVKTKKIKCEKSFEDCPPRESTQS